jgi:hypothetical protein
VPIALQVLVTIRPEQQEREIPKSGWLGTVSADVLLMHAELCGAFEREGISGFRFERALDREGAPLPWNEVRVHGVLPAMSVETTGMLRDGWFDDPEHPFTPVSSRTILADAPDLAGIHDWFGAGELRTPLARSTLASPRLVARPRVYDLCRRLEPRGVRFSPARVA